MQADMEIQSAAKLPRRHLRPAGGTGARSALKSLLSCNSVNCSVVNSLCKLMPKFRALPQENHHQRWAMSRANCETCKTPAVSVSKARSPSPLPHPCPPLREREHRRQRVRQPEPLEFLQRGPRFLPLPEGEGRGVGRGEGERSVRVPEGCNFCNRLSCFKYWLR